MRDRTVRTAGQGRRRACRPAGWYGRWSAAGVLVVVALATTGCGAGSSGVTGTTGKNEPAKVEAVPGSELGRLRLAPKAAERVGIRTAPVEPAAGPAGATLAVPYSAVVYDAKGGVWAYTNPEPLVYVRAPLEVVRIDGDRAALKKGPAPGTQVVTVGAVELFGTEFKTGK